jgi:protoporphyrinogen oxidase
LKIIFLGGEDNSKIVVSEVDLSSLFVEPAINYIKSRGGTVHFSTPVHSIERVDSGCVNLHSRNEIFGKYSDVIFAVPHHALRKISGIQEFIPLSPEDNMEYSSITTFHLFLKENPLTDKFLALVGSPVQWVFNHGEYITTVTSSSSAWDTKPEEEILSVIVDELNKYLGIRQEQILTHKMIKEKRATFICGGKNLNLRASTKTNLPNVYLAGDWTTTGLPATIEGAVLSGKTAALEVISKYS